MSTSTNKNKSPLIKQVPRSQSPLRSKKTLVFMLLFAIMGLSWVTYSFAAQLIPPALLTPANGAVINQPRPSFSWQAVYQADEYAIQVAPSSNPNFDKTVLWKRSSSTTFTSPKDLPNGSYLWRVRSRKNGIPGPWSQARSFSIGSETNGGGAGSGSGTGGTGEIGWNTGPGTTPGLVKAFDRANSVDDPAWFKKMYNRGFRLYILHTTWWGTCNPWPGAVDHIKWALDAGIKVGAYTRDPRCWKGGIEGAGPYKNQLQFFDIDVETDPGVKVTREMIDGIKGMGVRPLIYSGAGMWPEVMGNSTAFSDVPLYDTNVQGKVTIDNWVPSLTKPAPIPYGGWNTATNKRVALQQGFDVMVDGYLVDLNTFDESYIK